MQTIFGKEIRREEIEIMAPVGSYESLRAAIQAGANSVYFGIEQLNMRARSANIFTTDDLKQIVAICNEHQVKTYLTVNTVIYDHEMALMHRIIDASVENNITAIIAADLSVLQYASLKGAEIHASTQLNITNIEAVKFFARFCDVVVTARELNLNQVAEIARQIEEQNIRGPKGDLVKIEIFAHGALCMSVSGKCYLSLHEQNSSANRGACMQTCRKSYEVTEKESGYKLEIDNEYIMSPKDLCTLPFLDRLILAGVKVLKIEGRARGPEYVKTVVSAYNEGLDALFNGNFTNEKVKEWDQKLRTVFNRGFWDGYYLGRKLGEWSEVYGSRATKRKQFVGKCTNYFSKLNVAEITMESGTLEIGNELLIIGETTGVVEHTISEMRVELKPVNQAIKGQQLSILINELIRRGDKVYKLVDATPDLMQ
ncbi:MAG TPA: collagenase-like protease [Marinilabiliales bacterium]|nr:MAG: collagenase [Bacteroidetes bacterium GWA2_40_14]OFX56937.1 MAG: collagenase [Bacteroidetes bacterium GWC2_40_13]OFX71656.1 MAG: collagenase [Bacteroidetes bacterium GWD2_40_43]OFX90195.1 MAG: collagenase [Bacteroidetes bacterium GWE2_40_63]OFY18659.1 MAG: collagenase [Bacteroidetes bacterium GWF2_40_13]OFZ27659.1 MAG: collagenase [Bacteroidetes bacterium RIFOXYC2_FULL_40_12]HAM99684.1 collagenase-like protease [Marinilabiliales bacterium]